MKMRKLNESTQDFKKRVTLTEAEIAEMRLRIKKLYKEIEFYKEAVEPLRWELHELYANRDSDPWHIVGTDRIGELLKDAIDKDYEIHTRQALIVSTKWDIAAGSPEKPLISPEPACLTT
jgi:hypothetical protein